MPSSTLSEKPAASTAKLPPVESAPTAAPIEPATAPATTAERPKRFAWFAPYKKPALFILGFLALVAVVYYTYDAYTHEETDDAYVTGHVHAVATRINGVVTDVLVNDNQFVHAGDVLVKLDPAEYIALTEAAKANYDVAQSNLNRLQPLIATHAIAPEDVDKANSTRDVDLAQYELAKLQIQYSTLVAPANGYIGRKNVEVGNRVSSGQSLMMVVEPNVWVVGNFKETQLAKMRAGQPVDITIDSLPGKVFKGKVDSFSPATGNEFALLPADNSTGNFTKIVQRVPVKIVFDPESIHGYEERIRAGESVVAKVALTDPQD